MIKNKKNIEALLKERIDTSKIYYYKETTSTNTLAKEKARACACAGGSIFIAERQTAGRGKPGRDFFSPDGGIYISFLLTPEKMRAGGAPAFTLAAAVAACEAIENVTGRQPRIKWVNDILLDGKKIGGILTESEIEAESGCFKWVVVGIGINYCIREEEFPEELKGKAGSVYPDGQAKASKARMIAELINRMADIMPEGGMKSVREVQPCADSLHVGHAVPESGLADKGNNVSDAAQLHTDYHLSDTDFVHTESCLSDKDLAHTTDRLDRTGSDYADYILSRYKERLDTLGKRVDVHLSGESVQANAIDLDESGGLVIKKDDGTIKVLSSGEVW